MTAFWAIVLLALTVFWFVRAGRWAWGVDRERKKIHREMQAELTELTKDPDA
jgi:uncharacterized membrane protein